MLLQFRLEGRGALEAQGPFAHGQGQGHLGAADAAAVGDAATGGVEAVGFAEGGAVVDLEVQFPAPVAQDVGHQVAHAERAVDEAEQGLAALGGGFQGPAGAIHRHVEHGAGLDVVAVLLHQGDPAGEGCTVAVPGQFHGGAAGRVRIHVVAEGPLVALGEGLDQVDAAVDETVAPGADGKVGKAFLAHLFFVGRPLFRLEHDGIAQGQDAWVVFLQVEGLEEVPPFLPGDVVRGQDQADGAAQNLLVLLHAQGDALAGLGHVALEAFLSDAVVGGDGRAPEPQAQGQRNGQDRPGAGRVQQQGLPPGEPGRRLGMCRHGLVSRLWQPWFWLFSRPLWGKDYGGDIRKK